MNCRVIAAGVLLGMIAAGAGVRAMADRTVLVTVVAPDSGPLTTLTTSDFTLMEDKTKLEVTGAERSTDPLSIALVVDTAQPSGMMNVTADLRKALGAFVDTIHRGDPAAQIALLQAANSVTALSDFTANPAALQKPISVFASSADTVTVMLDGVMDAAQRLAQRPPPRRAIVCVAFGTAEGSNLQLKRVADAVKKAGATLWTVSVVSAEDTHATPREAVWNQVTAASGGTRQNTVQVPGLTSQLTSVANSLLSQYTLTFSRKDEGAIKQLKGQTTGGAQVLATPWMR